MFRLEADNNRLFTDQSSARCLRNRRADDAPPITARIGLNHCRRQCRSREAVTEGIVHLVGCFPAAHIGNQRAPGLCDGAAVDLEHMSAISVESLESDQIATGTSRGITRVGHWPNLSPAKPERAPSWCPGSVDPTGSSVSYAVWSFLQLVCPPGLLGFPGPLLSASGGVMGTRSPQRVVLYLDLII